MSQLDGSDDDELGLGPDATLGEDDYDGESPIRAHIKVLGIDESAANSTFFGISSRWKSIR